MIKAVVIDFDDTLSMTEEACFNLENATLAKIGHSPMSRKIHKSTWGQPLYEAIQVRAPKVDVDKFWSAMPALHEEFIKKGQIDVVPVANLDVLDKLASQGKKLIILTSRSRQEMNHLLENSHPLAQRVVSFYHRDNTEFHKPDPRVFDKLLREHRLKPYECVYVGESAADAQAAIGAGFYFIASLESGLRTKKDFKNYKVAHYINKFADLYDAVVSLDETHKEKSSD
jgi:phosphoglycolate phosphatase